MRSLVLATLISLSPVLAEARESIVGEWASRRAECGTPQAIKVEPQALAADEMMCEFPGVSRKGDVVTFRGTCDSGQGAEPETLTATLAGKRLSLSFAKGGGRIADLVRCPRR